MKAILPILSKLRSSSLLLNLSFLAGSTLISRLIGLVTIGYAARVLGPRGYGIVGFAISVVAYAGIIISPGFVLWGTREIARKRPKTSETLAVVNLTKICLAFIAYGALFGVNALFIEHPVQRIAILLTGTVLFNTALSVDWVYNGLELMRVPAILNIIGSALTMGGLFLLVRSESDLYVYLLIMPAAQFVVTLLGYAVLLLRYDLRLRAPGLREFKGALLASIPLGGTSIMIIILHYANNLIVQKYLGEEALGIFYASFKLFEMASTIPGILGSVFLARFARQICSEDPCVKKNLALFARLHLMLAFFIAGVFLGEAETIIGIIYGTKYLSGTLLLQVMSIGIIFNFAIYGYTLCLIPFGKDKMMLVVVVASAFVSVLGGFICVPRFGLLGAGAVFAVIDLAGWLVSLPAYKKLVGSLHIRFWLKPLAGGIILVFLAADLRSLAVNFVLRFALYVIVFFLLSKRTMIEVIKSFILSPEETKTLLN